MNKVQNGTRRFSETTLCARCRDSQIIQGEREDEHLQLCHSHGVRVPIPWVVVECNSFDEKSRPGLWEMEKVAWRFNVDSVRKTAGFMTPKQFKEKFPDAD